MKAEEGGLPPVHGAPLPGTAQQEVKKPHDTIIEPTLFGLKAERMAYKGVLTISVIITKTGPILVDYHVRFNDPAAQAFVPLIKTDIVDILNAMKSDTLSSLTLEVSNKSTVALVVASKGYPQSPIIGKPLAPMPASLLLNAFEGAPRYFLEVFKREGNC